ncbi:hypothetical protein AAC387_Pa02g3941 [Persea americana]
MCDFFLSVHIIREFARYELREKSELLIRSFYFKLIENGKVFRLHSETHAALPPQAWEVNSHFPVFLHHGRRKTGNCSLTAALIGGKLNFPVFLRSERMRTGNCSFTAASTDGKVDLPAFLRSERRETGNCIYAAGTCGGNLSIRFSIPFSLLLLVGGSWVGAQLHKMKDGHV